MEFETIDNSKLYCIYQIHCGGHFIITHSKTLAERMYCVLCDYHQQLYPKRWDVFGSEYFNMYFCKFHCIKIGDTFRAVETSQQIMLRECKEYTSLTNDDILKLFHIKKKSPKEWSCFGLWKKSEGVEETKDHLL
jgi:hypothetical protein